MEQQSKADLLWIDGGLSFSLWQKVFLPEYQISIPEGGLPAFEKELLAIMKEHRAIEKGGSKAFVYPNLVPMQPYYPPFLMVDDSDLYQTESPAE